MRSPRTHHQTASRPRTQAARSWRARILAFLLLPLACFAQQWTRHNDPLGFTVDHPPGWRVTAQSDGLVRVASPDGAAFAVVQPFLLAQPSAARAWLAQAPARFAGLFPQGRVVRVEPRPGRAEEAIASLAYGAGQATALCVIAGRAGMFYAIAAPRAQFAARRGELVRVLGSFRYTQSDSVRWRDPRENAFSIEIPRGWKATGGTFRLASVDTRAVVDLTSPDGQIRITTGDAEVPTYTEPTQMLVMSGFREGSWYSPGYGVRMMVRRYMTGVDFAAEYVRQRIGARCAGLRVIETRDRPDVARQLGAIYSQGGFVSQRLTVGEAAFTCGGSMRGLYLAGTQLTQMAGMPGGLWQVPHLAGYVAPADQAPLAESVLRRAIETAELNPEWARMQQGVTAATSRIVSQTHAEISASINESYWNRQRSQDELSRKWSNVILGQTDVVDPATGEKWKVAAGHNYYWRKEGGNQIAGTDTWTRPDIDFTPLKEW